MVSGVQNSLGASAYLKGSQLAGNNNNAAASLKREQTQTAEETRESANTGASKPAERTERSDDSRETRASDSLKQQLTSQLETKNDQTTLNTEQTRGSLLDIAV